MKSCSLNSFYAYLVLWILYEFQTMLMLKGIIAQSLFVMLMSMSVYAFCQVNLHYKTGPYIKWLNVMLIVLAIYGIILIIKGDTVHKGPFVKGVIKNYSYLQHLCISVLPIYAFYYFTLRRKLTKEIIGYIFFVLLLISILSSYQFLLVYNSSGKENFVYNVGYLFVPLIPMLHMVKMKSSWKSLLAFLMFGLIVLSMKRGAILTGGVVLLLFMNKTIRVRTKTQLASVFALLITSMFILYNFVMNLYETNAFFHKRVLLTMEGYSSQRDKIYSFFWNYFVERTSVTDFLLGHGANGTLVVYGKYAHNDWLEFAINQGLLGVVLYVIYWAVFAWECHDYYGPLKSKMAMKDTMIAYFLISLFSMSFANMPLAATLCIGYCMALNVQYQNRIKFKKYYDMS